MAHGLPDFYRGVDIAYQALAEMIVRPKYGAAQNVHGSVSVSPLATTDLFTVSGKGIIYGGAIYLLSQSYQKECEPQLYVDGVLIGWESFEQLSEIEADVEHCLPLYLIKYSAPDNNYAVALSHGITFETSFAAKYKETMNQTRTVNYNAVYALI